MAMLTEQELKEQVKELMGKTEIRKSNFDKLIEKVTYAPPETRSIWKEIHDNACNDRISAEVLFTDLFAVVAGSNEGHMMHGKLIASYLERMNKANDQLLKLAELIEASSNYDEEIDAAALYDEISKK